MQLFSDGKVWDIVDGDTIEGGHYVSCVARRAGNIVCVTWGALQPLTERFYKAYTDEAYAILSEEMLVEGCDLEGFDIETLRNDLLLLQK